MLKIDRSYLNVGTAGHAHSLLEVTYDERDESPELARIDVTDCRGHVTDVVLNYDQVGDLIHTLIEVHETLEKYHEDPNAEVILGKGILGV